MKPERHSFQLHRGGVEVDGACSSNIDDLVREAFRYICIYAQDGPVHVTGTPGFIMKFREVPGADKYLSHIPAMRELENGKEG